MKDICIYPVIHRDFECANNDWIKPISVGRHSVDGYLDDRSGVNISARNPHYNEITAQYWVRHNRPTDFVGFMHYRRYFLFQLTGLDGAAEFRSQRAGMVGDITGDAHREVCERILDCSDVIVPRATYFPRGLRAHYVEHGVPEETWEAFRHCASVVFPDCRKYIDHLVMSNHGFMRNMYVMNWKLFASYNDALMAVLDAVFDEVGGGKYPDANSNRYPGFLAEHFFNLWLLTVSPRTFQLPVINLE